jgi:hypothetical protein
MVRFPSPPPYPRPPPPPSPLPSQPRLKKRDVPKITFLEDRLMRKFRSAHPAAAAMESPTLFTGERTVSSLFIEQQMAALRTGQSEAEAFASAQAWMLSHSARVFPRLHPAAHVMAAAAHSPRTLDATRKRLEENTLRQLRVAQWALSESFHIPEPPPKRDSALARAGAADVLGLRARSRELQLPRPPLTENELQALAKARAGVQAREAKEEAEAEADVPKVPRKIPLPDEG